MILSSRKDINELIDFIEDRDFTVNDDWFYHASSFNYKVYKDILTNGIKSRFARCRDIDLNLGWNGSFYVSLTKKMYNLCKDNLYIWSMLYPVNPMFIVDGNIEAYKCSHLNNINFLFSFLSNTPIPIRMSDYVDEWHVFNIIKPQNIIGIQYAISKILYPSYLDSKYFKELLNIVSLLDELNLDLPIYDINSCREINKVKCLSFIK